MVIWRGAGAGDAAALGPGLRFTDHLFLRSMRLWAGLAVRARVAKRWFVGLLFYSVRKATVG